MHTRYVSFDVANKSLAIAIVRFECNKTINERLADAFAEYQKNKPFKMGLPGTEPLLLEYLKLLEKCNEILSSRFQMEYLNVIDLIPDRKISETSAIERAFFLSRALLDIRDKIPISDDCQFLVEYQMGPNDKSRAVSSQILLFCTSFMESAMEAKMRIKLVGPSLKNKLCIKNDNESYLSHYLAKFKTNYAANKNHTKYMLKKLTYAYNYDGFVRGIKKKNLDDAADAVCMAVAYFMHNI